ncbi:putative domain, di-copper centre [Phytophthora cactorum]|nr:putative domain, di-copper centre [Phytophthora cactorum]
MGGVMVYFQAPVDPVFYSHHSLIDLLQTIYLKCQNGDEKLFLSTAAKRSDPRFWTSCARSGGGNFSGPTISRCVRWPSTAKHLPNKYADFVDAKDLGNYSYTYNISGGLANMYENCNDSNTLSAVSLLADEKQGAALKKTKTPLLPTISDGTEDDDSVKLCNIALFETAQILGYNDWAASEQMEMIACAHHGECIGPVDDYSDLFRANFGVKGHTRCFSIMQDLVAGTRIIGIPTWREITRRFLPCPLQDEEDSEESEAAVA